VSTFTRFFVELPIVLYNYPLFSTIYALKMSYSSILYWILVPYFFGILTHFFVFFTSYCVCNCPLFCRITHYSLQLPKILYNLRIIFYNYPLFSTIYKLVGILYSQKHNQIQHNFSAQLHTFLCIYTFFVY
jgi:hypothetical protein